MDGPMEHLARTRTSVVPNTLGGCMAALRDWQRRGLWGHPIWLGPAKCHVYGVWRKRVRMSIEFTEKQITFVVHLNPKEKESMRAREFRAALLAEQAKIEQSLNKVEAEKGILESRRQGIILTLAMLDAPAKARKPRTPKAPPQTPPAEGEKGGA